MEEENTKKLPHHVQQKLCQTRPPYRQGKKLTAVKVYTVNDESQHLMINGVPKLQLTAEVERLCLPYGEVKECSIVSDYPDEEFTETFHVRYARIQSARIAKRFLDGKNFYGSILHVFYAPELETLSETRAKLIQRQKDVASRIRRNKQDSTNLEVDKFIPQEQYHRKKKTPALPLTEERLACTYPGETMSTIYNGIPQHIDPRPVPYPSLPSDWNSTTNTRLGSESNSEIFQAPYHPNDAILRASTSADPGTNPNQSNTRKRKNYKGQSIGNNVKVRIVRPQLVDTRKILKWDTPEEKKTFSNVKKVEGAITIKLKAREDNDKKRIIIKNPSVTQLIQSSQSLQDSIEAAKSQIRETLQKSVVH